jgi:hypothetical protein
MKSERREKMSNLQKWLDEKEMPMFTNAERLAAVLYTLGIASKDQLRILTSWTENQLNEAIRSLRGKVPFPETLRVERNRIKELEKDEEARQSAEFEEMKAKYTDKYERIEEERDKWLVVIRPKMNSNSYYTLGEKGVKMACDIRFEPYARWKVVPKVQVRHFVGINDILCRIRQAGVFETDWQSGREAERELYYYWNRYVKRPEFTEKGYDKKLACKPDAFLELNDHRYYLEFDTGTESKAKLQERFYNYLRLWNTVQEELPAENVVWVCTNERRKKQIIEAANIAYEHYCQDYVIETPVVPRSFVFVEGEETDFLLEKTETEPFWG